MQSIDQSQARRLLREAQLFDIYRAPGEATSSTPGTGEKSLAIRLTFSNTSEERALNDAQIDEAVHAVVNALQNRLGARLRH